MQKWSGLLACGLLVWSAVGTAVEEVDYARALGRAVKEQKMLFVVVSANGFPLPQDKELDKIVQANVVVSVPTDTLGGQNKTLSNIIDANSKEAKDGILVLGDYRYPTAPGYERASVPLQLLNRPVGDILYLYNSFLNARSLPLPLNAIETEMANRIYDHRRNNNLNELYISAPLMVAAREFIAANRNEAAVANQAVRNSGFTGAFVSMFYSPGNELTVAQAMDFFLGTAPQPNAIRSNTLPMLNGATPRASKYGLSGNGRSWVIFVGN